MARFLKDSDYNDIIQATDLAVIAPTSEILLQAEQRAYDKVRTKTIQRYDMDYEMGATAAYSSSVHYSTGQRVYQIAEARTFYVNSFTKWSETVQYLTGDIVKSDLGKVYTALQDSKNVQLTSSAYWEPMENIAPTDAPTSTLYNTATAYVVGNYVHTSAGLVYISIQNGTNKPVTNTAYWTPVTVTVNDTYWTEGDNRYALLVEICIDLTLHILYSRINPRNIPELRTDRYREAIDQLDKWASGTDNAEMMDIADVTTTGLSIIYGSSQSKLNNFFY